MQCFLLSLVENSPGWGSIDIAKPKKPRVIRTLIEANVNLLSTEECKNIIMPSEDENFDQSMMCTYRLRTGTCTVSFNFQFCVHCANL